MQLPLDAEYPLLCVRDAWPRCVVIQRHPSSLPSGAASLLSPFATWPAFPTSDYYEDSAPQPRRTPTMCASSSSLRTTRLRFPRSLTSADGGGAQLYPCSLAVHHSQHTHGLIQAIGLRSWTSG